MNKSLEEVHSSVQTDHKGFRRIFAFFGPAYLVSVGYMDPGNWATDIAGGSAFGYSLIWVLVMSNLVALLLQSHCARLGVVTGHDLAQASREHYPKFVNYFLYGLAEIAIAACDLAEVIGMAIGIHLLFPSVSIFNGVCITVLDSFLLLFLLNKGIRKLEAFIISLVALIGIAFLIEMIIAKPALGDIASGLRPTIMNEKALYIAIGIIGATVMPHNLYLHSSLVQTRSFRRTPTDIRRAIRFNTLDSAIALNLALFVNAAILIVSAATFYKQGRYDVVDILDAHQLLQPMLGSSWAPILFAVALIAAGQSSTVTGTLAGQIVMEGYLHLRIQPWVRRIITRLAAIVPALLCIYFMGEAATGRLLILSQVILSLQLGFAVIPLIHFVSDRNKMGEFAIPAWQKILSWIAAITIIGLNVTMVYNEISDFLAEASRPWIIGVTVIPLCAFCVAMLLYILILPFIKSSGRESHSGVHFEYKPVTIQPPAAIQCIGITVDFSRSDSKAINRALQLRNGSAKLVLIHVLESANAVIYGQDAYDSEREEDLQKLREYQALLQSQNVEAEIHLGFGEPKNVIPKLVKENNCDMVIMGTHGHRTLKDILLGSTIDAIRHGIEVPLVLV